ncbi:hypothetical protein ACCT25_38190, partial [Rhizobium ruizarguesonis]
LIELKIIKFILADRSKRQCQSSAMLAARISQEFGYRSRAAVPRWLHQQEDTQRRVWEYTQLSLGV